MRRRALRILVLLWLGWYLWGPVDPVFDFWDTPRQQLCDMVRMAGGVVALMGVGLATASIQIRKLCDRFRLAARAPHGVIARQPQPAPVALLPIPSQSAHSPPIPLRI
jgi:hypothetical protein